jgi:hypothetical protein
MRPALDITGELHQERGFEQVADITTMVVSRLEPWGAAVVSLPLSWRIRRSFWSRWQTFRFSLNKPQTIVPPDYDGTFVAIPIARTQPMIPLEQVRSFQRLPKDESRLGMRLLVGTGLFLNRVFPPAREGLPAIDDDIDVAIAEAVPKRYRSAFRAPVRPAPFDGDVADLAALAVSGPYSLLLERGSDGGLRWDLSALGRFEHHDGLCSLGLTVHFDEHDEHELRVRSIDSDELGSVATASPEWPQAVALAMCAASTHLALARHYNDVHLVGGDHWAIATRNELPPDHPLARLLWPSIFNSLYTVYGTMRTQLLPDGDYVNIYSFTHAGLIEYFDAMNERYDVRVTDPEADHLRRGLDDASFDQPSHRNLCELSAVMNRHADSYLHAYYQTDDALREDTAVSRWLQALDELIPNGIAPLLGDAITRDGVARLIAGHIYEGNTIHDFVGTAMWDYQLWADRNPPRLYRDGRRIPVDVLQRLVDNNFALQIKRAPLLADYGAVAVDEKGRESFTRFYSDCVKLQERYDLAPTGPWQMEPKNLEIGMNG